MQPIQNFCYEQTQTLQNNIFVYKEKWSKDVI